MADVVALRLIDEPEFGDGDDPPSMWECECGSVAFRVWTDGTIECRSCETTLSNLTAVETP